MDPNRVLAAISGGVDSSVAALLAKQEGLHVEGVTLLLPRVSVDDAAAVCEALEIPHHVADLGDAFERCVVAPFVDDYVDGRTPNPCVMCNPQVKFHALAEWAEQLECGRILTGHYARVEEGEDGPRLLRGADLRKDQSYMLYRLERDVLDRLLLPLGALTKREVVAMAEEAGLPSAGREESQDACFVLEGDVSDFVAGREPDAMQPGPIVDKGGEVLGEHQGLPGYTVGQRRGLGIGGPDGPYFVLDLRPEDNTLVVGPEEALWTARCDIEDVLLIADDVDGHFEAEVVTRLRGMATPAEIELIGDVGRVAFERPHRAPTPGQAAVLYDGDRVMGGGTVSRPQEAKKRWQQLKQQ